MRMGAWSMACVLRQRIEYYLSSIIRNSSAKYALDIVNMKTRVQYVEVLTFYVGGSTLYYFLIAWHFLAIAMRAFAQTSSVFRTLVL